MGSKKNKMYFHKKHYTPKKTVKTHYSPVPTVFAKQSLIFVIFQFVFLQQLGRRELLWTLCARIFGRTLLEVSAKLVLPANILSAVLAVEHKPPVK